MKTIITICLVLASVVNANVYLWGNETASISGFENTTYAYDNATLETSGPETRHILNCYGYDSSTINSKAGEINRAYLHGNSVLNSYGGSVVFPSVYDNSVLNIFDGAFRYIQGYGNSVINVHGGDLQTFALFGNTQVNFYGTNFRVNGNSISGEWLDGTRFATSIANYSPTTTIMLIPEPATLILLGIGGMMILRKKGW